MTQRRLVDELLNIVLHAVHLAIIVFSVVGWMFSTTRVANLLLLLAILSSWYVLGPILGKSVIYGYCLVTDIQWQLKKKLGHEVPTWGYMKYLADRIFGHDISKNIVNLVTVGVFFFSLSASITLLLV